MSISTRRIAGGAGLVVIAAVAYLLLWPVPADPQAWSAPTAPGYVGAHAVNTKLAGLRTIDIGSEYGPEHMLIGPDGKLYAAVTSGRILRMDPDGSHQETFANTEGRVLGFAFDSTGRMVAADAMRGLLAITREGRVSVLTDRVSDTDPIYYANSVVVARDGIIYFTDASGRFAPREWGGTYAASILDIMEQAATGRVLAHNPATAETWIVARGFSFANGIALSSDEQSLFVSETGQYRIWKVDSHARGIDVRSHVNADAQRAMPFIENLPGYPDNLMRGLDGRIWVGLFRPRNPKADGLAGRPFMRKVMLRLPRAWIPVGESYSHVFAFNEHGDVLEDWQDSSDAYPGTTGVTETADRMYIHSLDAHVIGWVARTHASRPDTSRETIYVLRSIREPLASKTAGCASSRTGFVPMPTDGERDFSFWSVRTRPEDGQMVDAHASQVATLHGCFGATPDRARQQFFADITLGPLAFHGIGECLALGINVPEAGLFPVRCQLVLSGLPAPYVGGLLTTNTITSRAALGGDTDPRGYTQASIATIRLWKAR